MKYLTTWLMVFVGFVIGITVLLFLPVLAIWWAWNTFMPGTFGLPQIHMWQALAFLILVSCIKAVVNVTIKR